MRRASLFTPERTTKARTLKVRASSPQETSDATNARQRATVIVTGVLLLSDPEVPISSMVVVPVGARLEALQVMVTVALPLAGGVTGLAEAVADTPLGNSFTLKSTAELNPFTLVTVRVVEARPPSSIVNEEGDRDKVKFFVPEEEFTVRAMVVV